MTVGVFTYGSLVLPESAAMTLGRQVTEVAPAALHGWRRRFSQVRHNLRCEKTFELGDGTRPEWILGLNIERSSYEDHSVNGVVIEIAEAELDRLDLRELRYDRTEVTGLVEGEALPDRVFSYRAKPVHHAPEPPPGAVIIAAYARTVERAFDALGPDQLDLFLTTTPYPVERVEATLVVDRIPAGNPRDW